MGATWELFRKRGTRKWSRWSFFSRDTPSKLCTRRRVLSGRLVHERALWHRLAANTRDRSLRSHRSLWLTMAKKLVYPSPKEMIRLGCGKPPSGTSTYTEPAPYIVHERPSRQQVDEVRRHAERPLEPVSRRTHALLDRALKKLRKVPKQ